MIWQLFHLLYPKCRAEESGTQRQQETQTHKKSLQTPNKGSVSLAKGPGKGTLARQMTLAAAAAKSLQSCPTLCNPIDGSLPGSAIPGILQARTPKWVAISFSNA